MMLSVAVMFSALGRRCIDSATEAELQGRAKRVHIPLQGCNGCAIFAPATESRKYYCSREPRRRLLYLQSETVGRSACAMSRSDFLVRICAFVARFSDFELSDNNF
ncbi:hypothetical protein [Microvirus mar44]|uniref:Uncharacterized protein n=1 Tax=Microvirus mar44 TaxID=2851179 RepID=A0A8F5RC34_9VIRU|nr:hypothetical protein [Microvirus mar44]